MSEADDLLDYDDEGFENPKNDELHIGLKILAFFIPIAGAVLYFVKKDSSPKASQQACKIWHFMVSYLEL